MTKLTEIKKQIYKRNKSSWNKNWNHDVKKILNNIDSETEIISAGQAINYKDLGNQYLGKYFLYIFNKLNLTEHYGMTILTMMLSFIFFSFSTLICLIQINENIENQFFKLSSIILSCFLAYYITKYLFYLLNIISKHFHILNRTVFSKYIFYILKQDQFIFYSVYNNTVSISPIHFKNTNNISYTNNNYEIILNDKENSTFLIYSKDRIQEIENLETFK